jgi:hypothetical protein
LYQGDNTPDAHHIKKERDLEKYTGKNVAPNVSDYFFGTESFKEEAERSRVDAHEQCDR